MKTTKTVEKPRSLAEIAAQLGVTAGAVSLALRDSGMVSEELKRRVGELVEESGFKARSYTRRQPRRSGEAGFSGKIGILYREDPTDPVTNTIMKSVAKRLTQLQISFGMFLRNDVTAVPGLIDGFSGFLYDYAWKPQDMFLIAGKPQVAIMNDELDSGDFDSVKPDDREAGRLAAGYLTGRGFRRIICVWERYAVYLADRNVRLESFRRETKEHGCEMAEIGYNKVESLPLLTERLKRELDRFDGRAGIFAFCDQVADHVCTALDFLGVKREPGRLELISCDSTYLSRQITPPVAMVDLHIEEIAERAVDTLLWRINHPDVAYTNILLKPSLIVPDTTKH